jgi:hypothetical protein
MERRSFFKKLGMIMAAVVVVPMVMVKAIEPKSKWAHLVITPASSDGFDIYSGGYWDKTLSPDEINQFYNLQFDPAEINHLLKLMPVRPVHFWINGKQVIMNGKIVK